MKLATRYLGRLSRWLRRSERPYAKTQFDHWTSAGRKANTPFPQLARPGSSGVEQRIENPRVGGSNPPPGTMYSLQFPPCTRPPTILESMSRATASAEALPVTMTQKTGFCLDEADVGLTRFSRMNGSERSILAKPVAHFRAEIASTALKSAVRLSLTC